jgi:hypothetical protein
MWKCELHNIEPRLGIWLFCQRADWPFVAPVPAGGGGGPCKAIGQQLVIKTMDTWLLRGVAQRFLNREGTLGEAPQPPAPCPFSNVET